MVKIDMPLKNTSSGVGILAGGGTEPPSGVDLER
jgi:hypothetical protein